MDDARSLPRDQKLQFLRDLEEEHAWISGDVLEIKRGLWAVHGVIAVDGNVLMAEFDSYDDARLTLNELHTHAPPRGLE